LLVPGADESQIAQAQVEWDNPEEDRESAKIMYEFQRNQAQAASGAVAAAAAAAAAVAAAAAAAAAVAAAAAAAAAAAIVIGTSSDEDKDDTAVAQSRSSPKNGKKRPRGMSLAKFGRKSMATDYNGGASNSKTVVGGSRPKTLEETGRGSNADKYKLIPSSVQSVEADSEGIDEADSQGIDEANSQEILPPSSSQDTSKAGIVRADWNSTNGANGAAATGVERQADDADDVPVFGNNNGGHGGNAAGRSFAVQPDGSALCTDTHANGTKQTSRWTSTGHGQWEKRDSV
jgi:hypothetical protein